MVKSGKKGKKGKKDKKKKSPQNDTFFVEYGALLPKNAYRYISALLNPEFKDKNQSELAEILDISRKQLWRYENETKDFWPEYYRILGTKTRRKTGLIVDRFAGIAIDGDPEKNATIKAGEIALKYNPDLQAEGAKTQQPAGPLNVTGTLSVVPGSKMTDEQADTTIAKMLNALAAVTLGSPAEAAKALHGIEPNEEEGEEENEPTDTAGPVPDSPESAGNDDRPHGE